MWMMALFKMVGVNYEFRRIPTGQNSIKSEAFEQPGLGSQNQQMIYTFCDRNTWLAPLLTPSYSSYVSAISAKVLGTMDRDRPGWNESESKA